MNAEITKQVGGGLDVAVAVRDLSKNYHLRRHTLGLLNKLIIGAAAKQGDENTVQALCNINFSLQRGESIGIIGRNGSGKSTLLQILAGTLQATSGSSQIEGRVGAILELGSGFHPDFTGQENLKMAMSLLGVSRHESKRLEPEIIEFAELAHAMNQPVKTYSQGMVLRLAFSIQTSICPNILLIDEALSVGDVFFQQKCAERVKNLQEQGTAFILVSHDTGAVRHYCQKALFLHNGKQVFYGDVDKAILYYHRLNGKEEFTDLEIAEIDEGVNKHIVAPGREKGFWVNHDDSELGDEVVRITKVCISDTTGRQLNTCRVGERILIWIYCIGSSSDPFNVGVKIKNRYGQLVTGLGAATSGVSMQLTDPTTEKIFEIAMNCSLEAGEYTLCFHVQDTKAAEANRGGRPLSGRFETPWLGPFRVCWDDSNAILPFHGMFGPVHSCRVAEEKPG